MEEKFQPVAEGPTFGLRESFTEAGDDPWGAGRVEVESRGHGLALLSGAVGEKEGESRPPASTPGSAPNLEVQLDRLLALDDFSHALTVAREILARDVEHPAAQIAVERCTENLLRMYHSKVGNCAATPTVRVLAEDIIWLDLDHRAGFVLSQVDGMSSFEEIVELTGMPEVESYRILAYLVENKIIGVCG